MAFIPEKRIERKASELLQLYSQEFNWNFTFPIPIEMIIEQLLEYSLDTFAEESSILGAIDQVGKIIYTNENALSYFEKYSGSYEFTLAHEVGHWALHCDYNKNQLKFIDKPVSIICRSDDLNTVEKQANLFAAALLMPEPMLLKELDGLDYLNWKMLYKKAEEWNVSITALKRRLEKLNMLYYNEEEGIFYKNKSQFLGQMSLFDNIN